MASEVAACGTHLRRCAARWAARIVFIVLPFSIVGVIAVHAVVFRPRMRNLNIIEQVPPTASFNVKSTRLVPWPPSLEYFRSIPPLRREDVMQTTGETTAPLPGRPKLHALTNR